MIRKKNKQRDFLLKKLEIEIETLKNENEELRNVIKEMNEKEKERLIRLEIESKRMGFY